MPPKPKPLGSFQEGKKYLLNALCKESLCSSQIRQRLKRREVPEEMIQSLIEEMIRYGFVDDRAWVESFVRRQQGRKDGPMMIRMKLRAKGIPKELIDASIPEESSLLREQVAELLKTRYRKYDLSDYKQRQKAFAAIARKGFPLDVISEVIATEI